MSAFKDAVSNDVMTVFLNDAEFADAHVLNNQNIVCLVDKDLTNEVNNSREGSLEGVFLNSVTIYVPAGAITQPVEGEILTLDGDIYIVRSVSVEMGILVIVAEVHNQ